MADVLKTIFMPRETLEKWLAALRSGQYKQGAEALCSEGRYCCLGVLQYVVQGYTEYDRDNDEELPSREWLARHGIKFYSCEGLPTNNPYIPTRHRLVAALNDDTKYAEHLDDYVHENNFLTIAALIERHAEAVG